VERIQFDGEGARSGRRSAFERAGNLTLASKAALNKVGYNPNSY